MCKESYNVYYVISFFFEFLFNIEFFIFKKMLVSGLWLKKKQFQRYKLSYILLFFFIKNVIGQLR